MELRQLIQFCAVADEMSFRKAAERLHMAQPPLSVAIRKLEEELGAPLFERRGRSIAITDAGAEALRRARQVLSEVDQLREAVRLSASGETGRVRIGFVGSATYALLPRLLPQFRRLHPGIELELRESTNEDVLVELEAGLLDLGLVRFPTGGRAPHLRYAMLERDVFQAVLPKGHPLASGRSVTLKALAQQPLIDYASSRVPGLHAMVMLAFQQAGLAPQVAQEATQVQTVISLVESGMGVALVPSVSARLASRRVVFRPIRGLPHGVGIGIALAWSPETESTATRRLRDVAQTMFPED
jgi:DNA-binding transcriptional LysR family regulator